MFAGISLIFKKYNVQALIREADGSCKTVYIAQIPPGTILPGNPTQIVINNQNYQVYLNPGDYSSWIQIYIQTDSGP